MRCLRLHRRALILPVVIVFVITAVLCLYRLASSGEQAAAPHKPLDRGYITLGEMVVHWGKSPNQPSTHFILNPVELCSGGEVAIVIVITSHVNSGLKRKAIRDTWGLKLMQDVLRFRVAFLLGLGPDASDIQEEFYQYGDIIQGNFTDGYRSLSVKSVMGFQWATRHCTTAKFVMKTDDDILIHAPNLLQLLRSYSRESMRRPLLLCHMNRWREIIREGDPGVAAEIMEKYHVSPDELPVGAKLFPPYCSGFGYIASQEAAILLYNASVSTPQFFLEDVYMTGFCRYKAGIEPTDVGVISLRPPLTAAQAACAFREGRVNSQELSTEEMIAMWSNMNSRAFFCPEEITPK